MSGGPLFGAVVALSGGVGGARLLRGLDAVLPPGVLTAVVNTGDDFEYWGLHIAPDLDTVMYTLAGLCHEERGWGLAEESFSALEMTRRYGGEAWFQIGDRDLATHLVRTRALAGGEPLSAVTARLCSALGVQARVLPMADGACRTLIDTAGGTLSFQDWFVAGRAETAVKGVRFAGNPAPAPGVLEALENAELVLIGPSNPYVSIDPILTRPGVRAALERKPVIAVSPIVGGRAVKGPLARMIPELSGRPPSPDAVVRHYSGLLRGIVVEHGDEAGLDLPVLGASTLMSSRADSIELATQVLSFAARLTR